MKNNINKFSKIYDAINEVYYNSLDEDLNELFNILIYLKGDPYLLADNYNFTLFRLIGLKLIFKHGQFHVLSIIGNIIRNLKIGDVIVKVNGYYVFDFFKISTNHKSISITAIRELNDTQSKLVFEEILLPKINSGAENKLIKLYEYDYYLCSKFIYEEFCKLIQNSGNRHLILDLSLNTGGNFLEFVKVCDLFFDKDITMFYLEGKSGKIQKVVSKTNDKLEYKTIYIVCSNYTMSTAEMLVFSLQKYTDYTLIIIGEETYGKFYVQKPIVTEYGTYYVPILRCRGFESLPSIILPDIRLNERNFDNIIRIIEKIKL